MTLELLRYKDDFFTRNPKPYKLGGVEKITCNTEYGIGHFAITIFDTRVFVMELFQYVKNAETGEYYVKNGVWVCPKCERSYE
ncbi:MAG: hypothetical protein ACI4JD_06785 [Ruminococcus sp.]